MGKLMKNVQIGAEQIKKAVLDLAKDLEKQRELHREDIHRSLIIALHTNSHWEKAKWR